MHTNSVITIDENLNLLPQSCAAAVMFNPPDAIDRHILDPHQAAALLGCNGNLESFASKSRNQDFHSLFPEISPAELLIDDFSCGNRKALTDSMAERSTFTGALIIPLREVEAIDKRNDSVSGIFPNSIFIKTAKDDVFCRSNFKYFFASFVTRELTFNLLIRLWKNITRHQTIPMKTFTNGREQDLEEELPFVSLEKLRRGSFNIYDSDLSDSERCDKELESECNDSPTSERSSHTKSVMHKKSNSAPKSDSDYVPIPGRRLDSSRRSVSTRSAPEARPTSFFKKSPNQKESESFQMMEGKSFKSKSILSKEDSGSLGLIDLARAPELPSLKDVQIKENPQIFHKKPVINPPIIKEDDSLIIATPMVSFSPIPCDCNLDLSKFKVLIDHSFQTNVDNLWKILYGSVFSMEGFMRTLWAELGYKGIQASAWDPEGAGSSHANNRANENVLLEDMQDGYMQNLEYIVPSSNPIGPKEIQTFVKNRVIAKETGNSTICLLQTSTTPFVTSGDCFEIHIRTCLTHDGNGLSKLRVAAQVVFLKSTWIRMVIERAAIDALSTYFEKLVKSLESHLATLQNHPENPAPPKSIIPTEPQNFIHHPLENELSALKREEEALKRKTLVDFQIWKRLSSIDIAWIMLVALAYMSWIIFQMHSELNLLKSQLEYVTESVKQS